MEPGLRFGTLVLAGAAAGLAGSCSCHPQPPPPRPSIVLISVDALRRDHLGFHGYERDVSPHLDRLARESLVFNRAYATASWTLISHMTMLTGLYASQHGVVGADLALSFDLPILAERLEALGYHSVALTAGGWVGERFGFGRGFARFRTHEDGEEMNAHLLEELELLPADRPFFLFVHVWDVHSGNLNTPGATIYEPPAGYAERFVPDARERLRGIDAPALWSGKQEATPEQVEALTALYDGSIRYVDELLGAWLERWRRDGSLERMLLLFTSDHGESLWQRGGKNEDHGGLREEGLQVPLLVRLPGAGRAGERCQAPVSHVDLVPTVLAALALPADRWLPGRSLLAELPPDRMVLADWPPNRAAYLWPYKHVWTEGGWDGWFFDLASDPGELEPIAEQNRPERFAELFARFRAARAALEASWGALPAARPEPSSATPAELQALRDLGYLGDG